MTRPSCISRSKASVAVDTLQADANYTKRGIVSTPPTVPRRKASRHNEIRARASTADALPRPHLPLFLESLGGGQNDLMPPVRHFRPPRASHPPGVLISGGGRRWQLLDKIARPAQAEIPLVVASPRAECGGVARAGRAGHPLRNRRTQGLGSVAEFSRAVFALCPRPASTSSR